MGKSGSLMLWPDECLRPQNPGRLGCAFLITGPSGPTYHRSQRLCARALSWIIMPKGPSCATR
eukprot:9480541-Alexandrium_andersonii.AAC.1